MNFLRGITEALTAFSYVKGVDYREELLESILHRRLMIVISSTCVAITAIITFIITHTIWPFVWLGADITLTVVRWVVISRAIVGSAQGRQRAWYLLPILMLFWSAVFGAAMFYLAYTREPALLINAAVLAISVSSAITSRNAATPRIAFLAILFVTVPFLSGVFLSLGEQKWIVFVVGIPLLLSSYSLTIQNHQMLVRLIWAERQARALAHTDALTGLPNRLSFERHQETLTSLPTGSSGYAYMCLDLDGFKTVNDHYGHPAGDLLLKAVAERLRLITRSSDVVFRIGGDEFIVYMPGASSDDCVVAASRIVTSLGEPFSLSDNLTVSIGCSAGSACLTSTSSSATILHVADEALYKAKREGKSRHVHAAVQ